jgi:hypothetical protein
MRARRERSGVSLCMGSGSVPGRGGAWRGLSFHKAFVGVSGMEGKRDPEEGFEGIRVCADENAVQLLRTGNFDFSIERCEAGQDQSGMR